MAGPPQPPSLPSGKSMGHKTGAMDLQQAVNQGDDADEEARSSSTEDITDGSQDSLTRENAAPPPARPMPHLSLSRTSLTEKDNLFLHAPAPLNIHGSLLHTPNGAMADGAASFDDEKKREHKRRSKNWTRAETSKLIKMRTELDDRFRKSGKKSALWEEIALSLQREKFSRDGQQCKDKWEKLTAGYKEVRDGTKDKDDHPFYNELHLLLAWKSYKREGDGGGGDGADVKRVKFEDGSSSGASQWNQSGGAYGVNFGAHSMDMMRQQGRFNHAVNSTEMKDARSMVNSVEMKETQPNHVVKSVEMKDTQPNHVVKSVEMKEKETQPNHVVKSVAMKEKERQPNHMVKTVEMKDARTNHVVKSVEMKDARTNHVVKSVEMKDTRPNHVVKSVEMKDARANHVVNSVEMKDARRIKTMKWEEAHRLQEDSTPEKRKREAAPVPPLLESSMVRELLDPIMVRQQRFLKDLMDAVERKEQLKEQMRHVREEKWRAEERAQRYAFSSVMIQLTHRLLGERPPPPPPPHAAMVATPTPSNGMVCPKKRSKNWKKSEVSNLIRVRHEMESKFVSSTRRAGLWDELGEKLASLGIKRDGKQCREKWDKLMAEYKDVMDGRKDKDESIHFSQLTAIFGRAKEGDAKSSSNATKDECAADT